MLKLRRGIVVEEDPLTVEVDGARRPAWADPSLTGECRAGDEVVVNTEAADLGLGSGGFDVVHVNLTRGLEGGGAGGAHVMKLNYTSLQHPVEPVERATGSLGTGRDPIPVLVIPLHGHLAPAAWAAQQARPEVRVGYVQTAGGALPGRISRDVAQLRGLALLCGYVTAAPAFGGEAEALSVAGALDAAASRLGWGAAIVGPGPGIIGSDTDLGHGGMAALDSAHGALALGMPTLVAPRISERDPRPRHRGLSHHTATVLGLLLAGVDVPVPGNIEGIDPIAQQIPERHRAVRVDVDLEAYAAGGLPTRVMGRGLEEDRAFFAAALAAGNALAQATTAERT
ncbi:MAG TPA: DUF3866 family protein [Solirubrobacterales bacterium]|nr:DUF3866 family protein [Solirubrobacterales bacterium]